MAAESRVLAMVLAGGAGKRLAPLTADRAKPAVPFGGLYRLIDFALSNLVNAGMRRICVLTQYKSHSLDRHITTTWRLSSLLGNYVTPVPAQQRLGPHWYTGSADAIYQSLNLIFDDRPDIVAVFGADHVFRMDPQQMIDQHIANGAAVTVAAIAVLNLRGVRESGTGFAIPTYCFIAVVMLMIVWGGFRLAMGQHLHAETAGYAIKTTGSFAGPYSPGCLTKPLVGDVDALKFEIIIIFAQPFVFYKWPLTRNPA